MAKVDQEDEEDEDENSSELVSPRGSMGSHRNATRSGDSDEGPIVLDVSSPRRTPRGNYGSLKKGQWQASEKESEAKFLSEVEKRVEERLKQQEEAMRSELMQQFKRTSVMTDKEKVLAEIDPKQVVKHFSVGKGYCFYRALLQLSLQSPHVALAITPEHSVRCSRVCCTVRR